jgi:hypothetical protein
MRALDVDVLSFIIVLSQMVSARIASFLEFLDILQAAVVVGMFGAGLVLILGSWSLYLSWKITS